MMNETNIKKMEEILANKGFAEKIQASTSLKDVYELLTAEGLNAEYEEFVQGYETIKHELVTADENELDADMLDMVSGGCKHTAEKYFALARSYARQGKLALSLAYYAKGLVELHKPCWHRR